MNFNLNNTDPRFHVYIHTSPAGKRYIGITSQPLRQRWGASGDGYRYNTHFYSAIQLYGWDAFKHEVVASGLDMKEASELESQLILKYDTMNPEHGYNQTTGGEWSKPSDEVRMKLSKSLKRRWSNPEFRTKMCEIQKNLPHKPLSDAHKSHISNSLKGRPTPWNTGVKLSEEHKRKLCGRTPWNKGETHETNVTVARARSKLLGRKFSESTKLSMCESRRLLYKSGYSPMWINNGEIEKQIDTSKVDQIPGGFVKGRLPSMYVTDGIRTRKILSSEMMSYIDAGWTRGKSNTISNNIRKSTQKYTWIYDGIEFVSAVELAEYLNTHGYPKIVGSTITSLYNKGFSNSHTYSDLDGRINRIEIKYESSQHSSHSPQ